MKQTIKHVTDLSQKNNKLKKRLCFRINEVKFLNKALRNKRQYQKLREKIKELEYEVDRLHYVDGQLDKQSNFEADIEALEESNTMLRVSVTEMARNRQSAWGWLFSLFKGV